MKKVYILLVLIIFSITGFSQKKSTYKGFPSLVWPKLYDITFVKQNDENGEYDKPIFSEAVKALNGKVITLPGYMIPFNTGMKGTTFMFSSLPLNACFFCGVGGPETVIEVTTNQVVNYIEKPIEIRGKLKLNAANPDKMIYQLEDAEIIGDVGF